MAELSISYEVSREGVVIIVRNKGTKAEQSRIEIPDEAAADILQDAITTWKQRKARYAQK